MLIECPECKGPLSTTATSCPRCGYVRTTPKMQRPSTTPSATALKGEGSEAIGNLLLLVPFGATLCLWYLMTLPLLLAQGLFPILVFGTIFSTAILSAVEASLLGMSTRQGSDGKTQSGGFGWFVGSVLLWFFAYPYYLLVRGRYGRKNLVVGGVILTLLFSGSACEMQSSLNRSQERLHDILKSSRF